MAVTQPAWLVVNLPELTAEAGKLFKLYFDCEYNGKHHLALVVAPWLRDQLMGLIMDRLDTLIGPELNQAILWLEDALPRLTNEIVDANYKDAANGRGDALDSATGGGGGGIGPPSGDRVARGGRAT